ncbi:MAG TPA: 16S rRNA (uracil(1498)-N(3))-methyltransferase, partial [Candidatus Cloacimonadota bacterium]|nr:16S rRNA (uracil(1498)-N(3))-methyltransferase [Candidatus Cloacimonadota bacterium]
MTSFYEPIKWSVEDINKTLTISGDEHHHIVNVSRYRVGDTIVLNNGKGQLAYGKIVNINKKSTEFLLEKIDTLTNTKPEIAVAFSLLKNKTAAGPARFPY